MSVQALRGATVAFAICLLSLVSMLLLHLMIRPVYFALTLGLWAVYSIYQLLALLLSAPKGSATERDKNGLAYWSGALASSIVAPLIWALIIGLYFSTIRSLP